MSKRTVFPLRALCGAAAALIASISAVGANPADPVVAQLLALPPPPAVDALIGLPQTYQKGRAAHLALITREAEKAGLPPAVADAVAHVESRFSPGAVGGVGEVGLMQIRPQTAAMLGYKGGVTGLFDPEINVHFGVKYLAQAWQLAKGDLCRTLMKYRAGHGEERMSPLSVEYCRRAREHLAAVGSPLANGALPPSSEASTSFAEHVPLAKAGAETDRVRVASLGPVQVSAGHGLPIRTRAAAAFQRELKLAQGQARSRRGTRSQADSERFWAAHEARVREIQRKLKPAQLRIAAGL